MRLNLTLCLFGFGLNNTFCLGNILLYIPQKAFAIPLLDELKIRGSLVFWNRVYKRGFFSHFDRYMFTSASTSIFSSFAVSFYNSFAKRTEQPRLIICRLHFHMDPGVHVLLFILIPHLKDKTFCLRWKW